MEAYKTKKKNLKVFVLRKEKGRYTNITYAKENVPQSFFSHRIQEGTNACDFVIHFLSMLVLLKWLFLGIKTIRFSLEKNNISLPFQLSTTRAKHIYCRYVYFIYASAYKTVRTRLWRPYPLILYWFSLTELGSSESSSWVSSVDVRVKSDFFKFWANGHWFRPNSKQAL